MKKIKVMTVFGTRPEIIRLSAVLKKLDRFTEHIMVHTGQNYDYELNEVFFKDLQLRKPNYFLEVKSDSLGAQIGKIIEKSETVILNEKPEAFLVLGDTNSALSSIIAKRYHIPVFHMEAGNRCFDERVPEELNRRIVDHIADINFCYTENARHYLLQEGLAPGKIFVSGSPMAEVLDSAIKGINKSSVLSRFKLTRKKYFVVTCHREENIDNDKNFEIFCDTLNAISEIYKLKIFISMHPRTAKKIAQKNISLHKNIIISKPLGFFDFIKLQQNSFCVISDSGTIFEESSILNFTAVVIRNSAERPEALDTGACIQTGMNREAILSGIEIAVDSFSSSNKWTLPPDYEPLNVSDRITRFIIGQANIICRKTWGNF